MHNWTSEMLWDQNSENELTDSLWNQTQMGGAVCMCVCVCVCVCVIERAKEREREF